MYNNYGISPKYIRHHYLTSSCVMSKTKIMDNIIVDLLIFDSTYFDLHAVLRLNKHCKQNPKLAPRQSHKLQIYSCAQIYLKNDNNLNTYIQRFVKKQIMKIRQEQSRKCLKPQPATFFMSHIQKLAKQVIHIYTIFFD